ncbi:MAG: DndE family protein [Pseudanabaenales cyanobacterium]|nr:DndE family protein [Pseudanabaenales cyanobacterium]
MHHHRCHNDSFGTDPDTLAYQLRLHLHRGIGYLEVLVIWRAIQVSSPLKILFLWRYLLRIDERRDLEIVINF